MNSYSDLSKILKLSFYRDNKGFFKVYKRLPQSFSTISASACVRSNGPAYRWELGLATAANVTNLM